MLTVLQYQAKQYSLAWWTMLPNCMTTTHKAGDKNAVFLERSNLLFVVILFMTTKHCEYCFIIKSTLLFGICLGGSTLLFMMCVHYYNYINKLLCVMALNVRYSIVCYPTLHWSLVHLDCCGRYTRPTLVSGRWHNSKMLMVLRILAVIKVLYIQGLPYTTCSDLGHE